ncbi:MinD/ParA family ATP-binding protein [Nocardia panacis]|nr:hypothetical protein [Nocardia panacis]
MLLAPAPGVETDPAQWGWRGKLNALGLRVRPNRTGIEVSYRRAVERIRQPLPGTPLVVVANPKGGTGVTPTVVLLSALFGRHRGGQIVAWDANEACGTLAARAANCSNSDGVWEVLGHARELCSPNSDASSLARFLQRQPTLDEILASDQTPGGTAIVGRDECAALMAVLRRHHAMVIADVGNNERAQGFRWAIGNATQLVIPVIGHRDAVVAALRLLDGVADAGHQQLAEDAVVVLAEVGDIPTAAAALDNARVAGVLRVAFDPALASGERIVLSRLPRSTIRAWSEVAATVADSIAQTLADRNAPLETADDIEFSWAPKQSEPTQLPSRLQAYAVHTGGSAKGSQAANPAGHVPDWRPGW